MVPSVLFLTNIHHHHHNTSIWFVGKILNTSVNFLGFLAALVAFFKIQTLIDKKRPQENTVDLFLLDFGVFFVYIYSCITITVGLFNNILSFSNTVLVVSGITEIIGVTFQTILIHQLLCKGRFKKNIKKCGRGCGGGAKTGPFSVLFLNFFSFQMVGMFICNLPGRLNPGVEHSTLKIFFLNPSLRQ